jgi:hypothetical protein
VRFIKIPILFGKSHKRSPFGSRFLPHFQTILYFAMNLEIWQYIISYCEQPAQLLKTNRAIRNLGYKTQTKLLWMFHHPNSNITRTSIHIILPTITTKEQQNLLLRILYKQNIIAPKFRVLKRFAAFCLFDLPPPDDVFPIPAIPPGRKQVFHVVFSTILSWLPDERLAKCLMYLLQLRQEDLVLLVLNVVEAKGLPLPLDSDQIVAELVSEICKANSVSSYPKSIKDLIRHYIIPHDLKDSLQLILSSSATKSNLQDLLRFAATHDAERCIQVILRYQVPIEEDLLREAVINSKVRRMYYFSEYLSTADLQRMLYFAIEQDAVEIVALLTTIPDTGIKVDQRAMYLAVHRFGKNRESSSGNSVLELLLNSNHELRQTQYVSDNAISHLAKFLTQSVRK